MSTNRILALTSDIGHENITSLCPDISESGWDILYNPPKGTECDFWIVYTTSRDADWMLCAPENTLYLAGEPPSKKVHPRDFYAQFGYVYSCNSDDPHPSVEVGAPCLNWHIGLDNAKDRYVFGNQYLAAMKYPEKINQVAVVCSNLRTTEGQRNRLVFLEKLKSDLGDKLVHFGRGFQPIDDKLDAILPYAYQLVLENSETPHYWTEKLADAFLGYAYPFYVGAPNVHDYFEKDSLTQLDMSASQGSIRTIQAALESNLYLQRQEEISNARQLILTKYNPFSLALRLSEKRYTPDKQKKKVRIDSHKAFRPFPRNLIYRIRASI